MNQHQSSTSYAKDTKRLVLASCLCFLLLASKIAHAEDDKILKTGVSFSIPPWVIKESNSGIELDILKQSLTPFGYRINPMFLPFARAYILFDDSKLDAILNAKKGSVKVGYYSDPVVRFQNVAISLASKKFPTDIDIDFLRTKHVVAFQNASKLLGEEFRNMAESNPRYHEIAKQKLQITLLFLRGVDFIIMDKRIFGYYWNEVYQNASDTGQNLESYNKKIHMHTVFAPSDYRFVFKSERTRNDFNEGLKMLKDNGNYEKIIKKYSHLGDLQKRITIH